MEYIFRLKNGQDLRKSIEEYVISHNIVNCVIVCGVGSLIYANLRLADGKTIKNFNNHYEIVSLMGTIAKGKSHIHISLADKDGLCIGGHLAYNNIINTTCEVCLITLANYELEREFDEKTGYNELTIIEKGK